MEEERCIKLPFADGRLAKVRLTKETPPRASLYDIVQVVCDIDKQSASTLVAGLKCKYPEVVNEAELVIFAMVRILQPRIYPLSLLSVY